MRQSHFLKVSLLLLLSIASVRAYAKGPSENPAPEPTPTPRANTEKGSEKSEDTFDRLRGNIKDMEINLNKMTVDLGNKIKKGKDSLEKGISKTGSDAKDVTEKALSGMADQLENLEKQLRKLSAKQKKTAKEKSEE